VRGAVSDIPAVVLLVEDDEDHAELVSRALVGVPPPSRVVHVRDGTRALDYLEHRAPWEDVGSHPAPRLILLDLRLPRHDGVEVLGRIREVPGLAEVPAVILTTSEAERDVLRARECRAAAYAVKPVGHEPFRTLLRELVVRWLAAPQERTGV
jgi:CheY-like chemotaxis protein